MDINQLLRPEILGPLVGAVTIIGGVAIVITKLIINHRERMAKIEHGIDPDTNEVRK